MRHGAVALVAFVALLSGMPSAARADAMPSPAATAAATAAPASDPCLSLTNLVSRPAFTTAACVVKRNALLLQAGYTNATTSGAATTLVSYPQESLGAGIAKNVEFDFNPPSIARLGGAAHANGDTDGSIGLKVQLGQTASLVYGFNALYTLQSGSQPFTGSGDGILANVNASLALTPLFGLFTTVGYNAQSAGTPVAPARYHDIQSSLGGAFSLPFASDVYVEAFDVSATGPGTGGTFGFDTGLQKDVGSRLQLDLNYYDYLTVRRGAHEHSIGFGAAYLFGP
jgi:hypothetical protein